jgi:hypothetical protein
MNKWLKQAGIVFIMASCMTQFFYSPLLLLDYYLNISSYQKECVNKAKPMLHCNGKCQLMKKLSQEEGKSNKNPQRRSNDKYQLQYFSANQNTAQLFNNLIALEYPAFNSTVPKEPASDFFEPPRV